MNSKTTAEKDRHYVCLMGNLLLGGDKQCYAADAVYRQVQTLTDMRDRLADMKRSLPWMIMCAWIGGMGTMGLITSWAIAWWAHA